MPSSHSRITLIRGASFALTIVFVSLVFEQPMLVANSEPQPDAPAGRPVRIGTGGKRGSCPEVFPPLIALVPLTEAKTTTARPTFWFYSPYRGQSLQAEFTLQSDGNNVLGQGNKNNSITVTLPATPGFVRIPLRPTDAPLVVNRPYHWFFEVLCGGIEEPRETVEGNLQRVAAPTPSQASDDRLFDMIASVAALRLQKPQDAKVMKSWKQLLRSLKFESDSNPLTSEQVEAIATLL